MWLLYAALASVCFGMRGILYQWTSKQPLNRNLLLLGVYLCGTVVTILLNFLLHPQWNEAAAIGLAMGLFSFVANASMYKGFAVGKASLIAILTALPPLVVVVLAYTLWGEKLSWGQSLAFLIILSGIVLIRYSSDLSLSDRKGWPWGVLALLAFGLTDISSKQATLLGGQTVPTLLVMYATGSLLFLFSWLIERRKMTSSDSSGMPDNQAPTAIPWTHSKTIGWGMIVGITNISGMLLILPAFRLGVTGLVSAVIAMNVLFILFYARFFLKEQFNPREVAGIVFTLAGMLVLRLLG